jgi:hypothetical protein
MQDISANVPSNRSHRCNGECCHAHHCNRFFFVSPLAGTVQEPQSATRGNERLRRSRTPSGLAEIVSDYSQYFTRWFIAHSNEGWNDFELQRRAAQKGIPTSADPSEISEGWGSKSILMSFSQTSLGTPRNIHDTQRARLRSQRINVLTQSHRRPTPSLFEI